MRKFQVHTTPRRVDFRLKDNDMRVARLGNIGMSHRTIASATNYSLCQVQYRLHKARIKTSAYRNGTGPVGKLVLHRQERLSFYEISRLTEMDLRTKGLMNGRKA